MSELHVTRAAAREIVSVGSTPGETSFYEAPSAAPPWEPGLDVRPCRLTSSWQKNDAGVWRATACFINAETAVSDVSFQFDVYCPAARDQPEGDAWDWRFWAIWRGRWESLQQPVENRRYVGGDAISVLDYDSTLGGYPIVNEGVREVRIPGDSYVDAGTFYLNRNCFQWYPSTLDIQGKKELLIATHYETVVTDVVDGEPVKKLIPVVGARG